MHRPYAAIITLSVTLATLAACDDSSRPAAPTQPAQAVLLRPGTPACDAALEKQVNTEIGALYTSPEVTKQARDRFDAVVAACQANDQPLAREQMFVYVDFTIDQARAGTVVSNAAVVSHWNTLFLYVFLPAPNAPAAVLASTGGANVVFKGQSGYAVRADGGAGVYIRTQDNDPSSHLYTIQDASSSAACLVSELEEYTDECDEFRVYPAVTAFRPFAVVIICESVPAISATPTLTAALAHQRGSDQTTRLANPLTAAEQALFDGNTAAGHGPVLCQGDVPVIQLGAADGLFEQGWQAVTTLASRAAEVFGPPLLYAGPIGSGLGGSTGSFSPFGGVNRVSFYGTFNAAPFGNFTSPFTDERGTWAITLLKNPGSVVVQQSLGDLVDKPVVLSQGGGNCTKSCGGLILRGELVSPNGTFPTYGRNIVSWRSLQAKPTLKVAPFVIRASDGKEIARVSYETAMNNTPIISYNGAPTGVLWVQNKSQLFEITVDLDAKTTSLRIDGALVGTKSFVNSQAASLRYIAAEFTGIDAGIVGWDFVQSIRDFETAP